MSTPVQPGCDSDQICIDEAKNSTEMQQIDKDWVCGYLDATADGYELTGKMCVPKYACDTDQVIPPNLFPELPGLTGDINIRCHPDYTFIFGIVGAAVGVILIILAVYCVQQQKINKLKKQTGQMKNMIP